MYVEKILLTLMFTTLYLAPGAELAKTQPEETAQQPEEVKQLQVKSVKGIYQPLNDNDLLSIWSDADRSGKLCFMYYVYNTNEYDEMFENLSSQHSNTMFNKIDLSKYLDKNGNKLDAGTEPEYAFYKFGKISKNISFSKDDVITATIETFENMDRQSFIQLIEKTEKEVQSVNGIYQALSISDLSSIFRYADDNEKLCLIYQVHNTNDYDLLFENLTSQHSNTVFVKMDSSKFLDNYGRRIEAETSPKIHFYKFGKFDKLLHFNMDDDIAEKIRNFEYMDRESFIQLIEKTEKEVEVGES